MESANKSDPMLMNAFNTVNLAGACILTSTAFAEELGVPKDKWVYPVGAAGTRDSYDCAYFARNQHCADLV